MILGTGNFPVIEIKRVNDYTIIKDIWGVQTIEGQEIYLSEIREVAPYTKEQLMERIRHYIDKYGLDYAIVDDKRITWMSTGEALHKLREVVE